ncbi:MAG: helix-turn-helix transcriptional regulator [Gemmatimonadota bacterium]
MVEKHWRQRMLSSTRGRVLSLLRWGPRTVNELADTLELTDNAVRIHLAALERDGLVQQQGVRRGIGKPAYVYHLSSEAESLFPKAYATVLSETLAYVREQSGSAGLEAFVRAVGKRAGQKASGAGATLKDRLDAAVAVLQELGGLAEVQEDNGTILIRGFSCPLSEVVGSNPEACALAEELVSGIVGKPVVECCERNGTPRCAFRIDPAAPQGDRTEACH